MKTIAFAILLLSAGYWAALHQDKLKSWWQDVTGHQVEQASTEPELDSSPQEDPAPAPAPAPPPAAVMPPPAVAVMPPPTLDEGFYFTRERISQMTDGGVVVIPERTEVRLIEKQDDGRLLVEAGGKRVATSRSKLTNDSLEVRAMMQESKAASVSTLAASPAKANTAKSSATPALSASELRAKTRQENTVKRQVLQARIDDLSRQINQLNAQILDLQSKASYAQLRGRPTTYFTGPAASLQAQVRGLEAQRSELNLQLAAIPPY